MLYGSQRACACRLRVLSPARVARASVRDARVWCPAKHRLIVASASGPLPAWCVACLPVTFWGTCHGTRHCCRIGSPHRSECPVPRAPGRPALRLPRSYPMGTLDWLRMSGNCFGTVPRISAFCPSFWPLQKCPATGICALSLHALGVAPLCWLAGSCFSPALGEGAGGIPSLRSAFTGAVNVEIG